ncbi:hypothetical protein E4U47_002303 [Claviceps purpurea]|nr:hypothetical protein E4U47_002303 [Claviceps purpurea]
MASFSSTRSFLTLAQAKLWQDSARRLRALGRLSAWPQRGDPSWHRKIDKKTNPGVLVWRYILMGSASEVPILEVSRS